MRPVVIGTGFVGRVITDCFLQSGLEPLHTFNTQRYFPDSVRFDFFSQAIADTLPLPDIDTVVIAAKIEDLSDTDAVVGAMTRLFEVCRRKRVIYLSSDAVFDGRKGYYTELDVPRPTLTYGRHKKLCEDLLHKMVPDSCIVRTSYIYGYSLGQLDSRLANVRASLRSGLSVHKFVDMYKSPVEVNQLAEIILKVSHSQFRGILHACGERLSIHEFFRQSLNAMGENTDYLLPAYMPFPEPADCLRDTSLDSSCLRDTFGIEALPLNSAFGNQQCHHEGLAN